jgi:hypothetical protein
MLSFIFSAKVNTLTVFVEIKGQTLLALQFYARGKNMIL